MLVIYVSTHATVYKDVDLSAQLASPRYTSITQMRSLYFKDVFNFAVTIFI